MAIRKITEYPAKVLANVGEPVVNFDEDFKQLTEDMFETMSLMQQIGSINHANGAPYTPFFELMKIMLPAP